MGQKRTTVRDLAKITGVSIATVSRYLNQDYSSMSQATRLRIQEAVEQSGSIDLDLNSSAELQEVSVELERIKSEARASEQNLKLVDIQTSKQ